MKFVTIVGARPQFIKAAFLSKELRKKHTEILVHTGQHFDDNMSKVFFDELDIPEPNYNLGISGGTHAQMTARMLIEIEKVLITEQPDAVILYGDTNSTLAGSICAVKLSIPVIHIEAGNRVGTLANPEEINRICTDHISSLLFYCVPSAGNFLIKEGLIHKSFFSGDLMYDAFLEMSSILKKKNLKTIEVETIDGNNILFDLNQQFIYLTCHRQENDDYKSVSEILRAANSLNVKVVYPVHPRNSKTVLKITTKNNLNNIILLKPVGYLESLSFILNSKKIITDSGGVQREAFFAKKQCVTILDFVCWPETMVNNCNQLAKPDYNDILSKINNDCLFDDSYLPFGNGNAKQIIVNKIEELIK